jgi:hypothetical protein
MFMDYTYRGWKNNGNTTDTVHISLLIWCLKTLPSKQLQCFLEWTYTSFEQSLAGFYTILLEEHLQVALEMLGGGGSDPYSSLQN